MLKVFRAYFNLIVRHRVIGVLLIILGFYLALLNPIFSMLYNEVYTIGFYVPLEPLNYWIEWLFLYGWFTILFALVGVYLIIFGYRYSRSSPKEV